MGRMHRLQMPWGSVCQAEGTESAKALRREAAWPLALGENGRG